jgi:hypothetical protein
VIATVLDQLIAEFAAWSPVQPAAASRLLTTGEAAKAATGRL